MTRAARSTRGAATARPGPGRWTRIAGWVAGTVVFLVLLVPVLLLPVSTAVPLPVWVGLLAVDLALAAWLTRSRQARPWGLAGVAVAAALAVWASQAFAATPAITGTDGRPVPGSVATLEKVTLNGSEQWITIRGHDPVRNPVLLNLGMGGPGGGGFATRTLFDPLEEHFTVVSWDEPGTGKSYGAVGVDELTRERFVADAVALTDLLRERFGQERIFLYGVSWTSILGIWLVDEHPELYHALVTSGQMVNTTENDELGYALALEHVRALGDTATVATLEANGPPPYTGTDVVFRYLAYLDVLNDIMGAPRYAVVVPIVPFLAPEYGLVDKVNHTRGLIDSFNAFYPKLADLDLAAQVPRVEVPVWFFVGRADVNAMASLVEDYHAGLDAPRKELVWLEGGHGLGGENLDQFVELMVTEVRPTRRP